MAIRPIPRSRPVLLLAPVLFALLVGCAQVANKDYRTFWVESSNLAVEYTPQGVARVLEGIGYQRVEFKGFIPQSGPYSSSGLDRVSGEIIETPTDFQMVFRSDELPSMRVRVRIVKRTGGIHVGVADGDSKQLGPAVQAKVEQMLDAFRGWYGPAKVHYPG